LRFLDLVVVVAAVRRFLAGRCELSTATAISGGATSGSGQGPAIAVLLPLLEEQATVSQLVERMRRLEYNGELVDFYLITTANEGDGPGTTAATVKSLLAESHTTASNFLHLHAPATAPPRKAHQLNYALANLRRLYDIVGVYDADSAPAPGTLSELAERYRRTGFRVAQQFPVYFGGGGVRSRPMDAAATLQTARAICIERPRQRRMNERYRRAPSLPGYSYLIGHGQFFGAALIGSVGFPVEPLIDDIQLGMALSARAVAVEVLACSDTCGVPETVTDYFRQTRTWFAAQTDLTSLRGIIVSLGGDERLPLATLWGITVDALAWALRLPHSAVVVASVVAGAVPPVVLARHVLALGVESWLERQIVREAAGPERVPPWAPIWLLAHPLKAVGPWMHVLGGRTELSKTPRRTAVPGAGGPMGR
jgi:hypothetical protein